MSISSPAQSDRILLLTAFEPFDGEAVNPSWEVTRTLDGEMIANMTVRAVCLPCVFGDSLTALAQAIDAHKPSMVISLGQAGGRCDITPERVAINLNDARIPDNAGSQPIDEPIDSNAPAAYFTTLPIKAMVQAMRAVGVPASVSYTAGTFVCNHVFYGLQHLAARGGIDKSGFVHIPYLPEQAAQHNGQPSLSADTLLIGLRAMLSAAITTDEDLKITGGKTH
ncbi:pyroglutamyl-peptidase I [Faucicola atlantae]|uniref:Pyrrolidone-carboxylate peptidase n=1 Tax=Faucicola atlantae TaxID=34059 RepID=A0A1B8QA27_9GAMM|nr:pyroglutamyl-peptidase I [Moraxella atlantae]OBX75979.1 pyroglutamyl-peptidase I [Moraxella atlantae]